MRKLEEEIEELERVLKLKVRPGIIWAFLPCLRVLYGNSHQMAWVIPGLS